MQILCKKKILHCSTVTPIAQAIQEIEVLRKHRRTNRTAAQGRAEACVTAQYNVASINYQTHSMIIQVAYIGKYQVIQKYGR